MNLKEPMLVLGPILLLAALLLSFVTMPKPVQVREVVVEKETRALSITEIYSVCHNDMQAWAINYVKSDGSTSWFIAAEPPRSASSRSNEIMYGTRCDGSEKPHPGDKEDDDDQK